MRLKLQSKGMLSPTNSTSLLTFNSLAVTTLLIQQHRDIWFADVERDYPWTSGNQEWFEELRIELICRLGRRLCSGATDAVERVLIRRILESYREDDE